MATPVEPCPHDAPEAGRGAAAAGPPRGLRLLRIIPTISYPVLAHAAILTRSPVLTMASVGVLATVVLLPGLLRRSAAAWLGAAAAIVGMAALSRLDAAALVLFLPPTLVSCYMAWLFGHTLVAGRMPLIEVLARRLHAPGEAIDPDIPLYAARLTGAWTALFVLMAAANTVLALLAYPQGLLHAAGMTPPFTVPIETWSLFANVLNYLIVAALFLAEYAYRRRRFPKQPYRNFIDFLRRAALAGPAVLQDIGYAPRGQGP